MWSKLSKWRYNNFRLFLVLRESFIIFTWVWPWFMSVTLAAVWHWIGSTSCRKWYVGGAELQGAHYRLLVSDINFRQRSSHNLYNIIVPKPSHFEELFPFPRSRSSSEYWLLLKYPDMTLFVTSLSLAFSIAFFAFSCPQTFCKRTQFCRLCCCCSTVVDFFILLLEIILLMWFFYRFEYKQN